MKRKPKTIQNGAESTPIRIPKSTHEKLQYRRGKGEARSRGFSRRLKRRAQKRGEGKRSEAEE